MVERQKSGLHAVTYFGTIRKHRIVPGKELKISKMTERIVAFVEFLGYLHSLKTMLGGVIVHGGRAGTKGKRNELSRRYFFYQD